MRTFLAVEISDPVRSKASKLISRLSRDATGVKWVEPDNLHLTLKFFGEISDDDVSKICTAVGDAVSPIRAFDCECVGIGAFPRIEHPRTIWVGLADAQDRMARLQEAIEQSVSDLGFPREKRAFHGHLTLGRVRDSHGMQKLSASLQEQSELSLGTTRVSKVTFFASQLRSPGPTYTPLARLTLRGA